MCAQYGHFFHTAFTGFAQFGHLSATVPWGAGAGGAAAGVGGGPCGGAAGRTAVEPGTGVAHFGHFSQEICKAVPQTAHFRTAWAAGLAGPTGATGLGGPAGAAGLGGAGLAISMTSEDAGAGAAAGGAGRAGPADQLGCAAFTGAASPEGAGGGGPGFGGACGAGGAEGGACSCVRPCAWSSVIVPAPSPGL